MKTSSRVRFRPLGVLLAGALVWSDGAAAAPRSQGSRPQIDEEPVAIDRITPALQRRIAGRAGLGDVRVDVFWSHGGRAETARIFGNGVGIWRRNKQFRLTEGQVLETLRLLVNARFGSMPDRFGEDEAGERNEGPRLIGRLFVRAGTASKSSMQLVDGDQSKEFARLVEKILAICEGPASRGVSAASMTDALRLLASGTLSPEVLEVTLQKRPDSKGSAAATGWILRLNGRDLSDETNDPGRPGITTRRLELTDEQFREIAVLLSEARPSTLPQSLYAPSYTDLRLEILGYSRAIAGRKFLGMTPETHGEKQAAFERICATLETLHDRARNTGTPGAGGDDENRP